MRANAIDKNIRFLSGSGEMATLTREKDWSKTSLDVIQSWPQSLRTTLGILLNSKFPMFLFWGPELICFYNDSYRPSLGNDGKHAGILGIPGADAWPEIWSIIKPLIDQVLAGKGATWSEDQLIPIYRNGHIEDVYWTFSYSPVNDESEKIAGVLVTCSETTDKIITYKKLEESRNEFQFAVEAAELGTWDLDPATNTFKSNKRLKAWFGLPENAEMDLPLAINSIAEKDRERVIKTIQRALEFSSGGDYETEYSIINPETKKETIVQAKGKAWFNDEKIAYRFNGTLQDVTAQVLDRKKIEESEKRFRNTVEQAPLGITIFRGPEFMVEMANETYLQVVGRTEKEFVGRPLFHGLPEVKESVEPLLTNVLNTGIPFYGSEFPVTRNRYGKEELTYFNFVYHPLKENDGSITGIIVVATEVTASVKAKHALAESEKRLSIVLEASGLATWELNVQTNEVWYSEKYFELFGYKKDSVLAHNELLAHLHPEDLPGRNKSLQESYDTGALDFRCRIILNDKSLKWIEAKGKVFYDEQNKPSKLIGTARDITEEKKYQQKLEESEQKFRLLADSMPQFVWTGDAEGNLNYFNQSVYNYSGLTPARIEKEGWLQIVHPDEREENISKWLHSIKTGENFLFEHRFKSTNGEYRWQLSRAIPQKDINGKIEMWVGTSTDIEEQKTFTRKLEEQVQERTKELKQLNDALKKSEERYHMMVEEVQDYAILYLDKNGIVENWNKGAEKIKGYKANEIIGKSFSSFYSEKDRKEGLPLRLLNIAAKEGRATQEGWRIRKDGTAFWASVTITAVHDEKNEIIGYSKVTHDLTEKKEADDQLKRNAGELERKNKELLQMNTELQSFAYVSSHDLQEPLRKIQVFVTMINETEAKNLSEKAKDYLGRMENAAARMQTLIKDLLTYSRTNTTERKYEKTDLNKILYAVTEELKEDIQQSHATIESNELCEVNVIPFQLQQLLINLIGNAIKFSSPSVPPHIIIKSRIVDGTLLDNEKLQKNKTWCHISVSDNGIGFEQQYKDRIFEVFQRLHGKTEFKGTGIGLAIVKKIVENHEGIVTATGESNKGATFDIYIPA